MKLNSQGNRGQPDRLFYTHGGRIMFVEFKAPGEKLRELQAYQLASLATHGFNTYVVDNVEDGKRLFADE